MIQRASFLLPVVARAGIIPINLLALHLLWRGHDAPGGGFIAGVATAISLVLYSLGTSVRQTRRSLKWHPAHFAMTGAALLLLASVLPTVFGDTFFTLYHHEFRNVPVIGKLPVSTALLFDVGVYLLVVGTLAKLVFSFGLSAGGERAFAEEEVEDYSGYGEHPVEESAGDRAWSLDPKGGRDE